MLLCRVALARDPLHCPPDYYVELFFLVPRSLSGTRCLFYLLSLSPLLAVTSIWEPDIVVWEQDLVVGEQDMVIWEQNSLFTHD